ncbi:hypothetical protein SM124_10795 [Bacillus sp. 31A1R]|uniref:Uncharacterized protein n=1 Tax=Robertmurraya mangrovi TaxID=3098077 RepID=A0ABU5IYI8_9BACI|nr:hypothetical protein [Bacillus sp. 31A1R]
MELKEEKRKTIQDIIRNLSKVTNKVEIVDKNLDEIIDFFDKGYPYDEEDPQSIKIHSLRLRLYVNVLKKRKAILQIEMVSSNALLVDFWFSGDDFDEPGWDQIGIKKEEFSGFTSFLIDLYSVYEFKIGGIAIEQDILELYGFGETYPNECYRYENFSPDYFLKESTNFLNIIWREKYKKLSYIPYIHKRIDKEGILIEMGNTYP